MERRGYLATLAGGYIVGLAGCAGGGTGGETTGGETTGVETTREETTETGSPATTTGEPATTTATAGSGDGSASVGVYSNYYQPVRLSVPVGTTVTWTNQASGAYATHTVTSARFHETAASWSLDARLGSGDSTDHTFDSPGVYEYYCTIHGESTMCGAVLVGDATLESNLPCE
ncbi:cupredoxin domain-containing protein [Halobaculum sp. EA56]|uniref:cupredoxin domain-containing protein n=1 Tax=Halobaculum sp. EA56 TaxID=3421648 RepID=UPI003EBE16C8